MLQLAGTSAAFAGLAGCFADDSETEPGVATIAPATGPTTLDPHNHQETTTSTFLIHFYDGLVTRDADMNVAPALAEDWENVDDTTWEFRLRTDVEFHNGEPFTVETAKYNLDRVSGNLNGAETTVNQGDYSSIDSVEIVDDSTIRVNLAAPDPIFLGKQAQLRLVPKQYTEENGFEALNDDPIGTGPYELEEWQRDQEMVMIANSEYFRGEPPIGEIRWLPTPEASSRISLLTTGDADLIRSAQPRNEERVESNSGTEIKRVQSARGAAVWLNMKEELPSGGEPAFHDNPEVRRAVNYATDIDSIIENILLNNGSRIHGWAYNDDYVGYNSNIDPYPHDPDQARELLAEGGFEDGFETTLLVPRGRYFKGVSTAEAIATQLGEIGIDVSIDSPEFGTFAERTQQGDIPGMMFAAWGNPTFNPVDPYSALVDPQGLFSLLPENNQPDWVVNVISLIDRAQTTGDREELASTVMDIERILHDQAAFNFTFQYRDVYGINSALSWEPRTDELVDLAGAELE
jgi:peptide/nickel transport system substrate-binding protein